MRTPLGAVLCLISAVGFGLAPIFAKEAYAAGVSLQTLLVVRFGLAALLFWLLAAWRRPRLPSWRVLLVCLALGAVGYAGQAALYFGALTLTSASLVSLLLYAYPAIVTGIAVALRRQGLDRGRVAALTSSALGLLLLLGTGDAGNLAGVMLALGAAVTYALYLTVADGLPRELDLFLLSAVVCTGAAASVTAFSGLPSVPGSAWPWLVTLAVFSTVVPIVTMFAGVRSVGASTAAILSCVEPAVTVASTALVYGESLTAVQLLGGAAVVAAIFMMGRFPRRLDAPREREFGST
ncbi:DMT family transporter [Nonomuraea soli]|uniref:Drug/metabolite transporter (DMT)-like permease n=1 Tax=Nonomuraea soli TaxID=1032476 RepID=A0A7W0CHZ5_9ACTN|nr:DMT family transporter [Nonomuraea soli]MBA2891332.1 drug/metabolite transporter (DMT)-like permease [Nonomuraea soli]